MRLPSFVIPDGEDKSNALDGGILQYLESITIYGAASLSGTVKVRVSDKPASESVDDDYRDLQSGGSDVTVTAGNATVITEPDYGAMRLETSVAPTGDETHDATGHEHVGASV